MDKLLFPNLWPLWARRVFVLTLPVSVPLLVLTWALVITLAVSGFLAFCLFALLICAPLWSLWALIKLPIRSIINLWEPGHG